MAQRIALSVKDTATETLEQRLWDAADQFRANSGLKAQEYSTPVLGLEGEIKHLAKAVASGKKAWDEIFPCVATVTRTTSVSTAFVRRSNTCTHSSSAIRMYANTRSTTSCNNSTPKNTRMLVKFPR